MPDQSLPISRVPSRLVFRIPLVSLLGVLFLVVCESPVALAASWLLLLYLIPVGLLVWLLRTRTVADADRVVVRRVFSRRVLPWSRITSLRMREGRWLRAVLADGGEVTLPLVRTRHLSALALISGGRLTDPLSVGDTQTDTNQRDQDTSHDASQDSSEDAGTSDDTPGDTEKSEPSRPTAPEPTAPEPTAPEPTVTPPDRTPPDTAAPTA